MLVTAAAASGITGKTHQNIGVRVAERSNQAVESFKWLILRKSPLVAKHETRWSGRGRRTGGYRPEPATGLLEIIAMKQPFAVCGKLRQVDEAQTNCREHTNSIG